MLALMVAATPVFGAATPCDGLRAELRDLAAADPSATEDGDKTSFLWKVIQPKVVKPTAMLPSSPDTCESIRTWLEQAKLSTDVVDDFVHAEFGCYESLDLYDERAHGGFIALGGDEMGSANCPIGVVLALDKGKLQRGFSYEGGCARAQFLVLRLHDASFPAVLASNDLGSALEYRLDLYSGDPSGNKVCSVTLRYKPQFRVAHWFGPKGEGDVDRALRRIIEPIVLTRATGRETQSLVAPFLDHPRGDSPYDQALAAYPAAPITTLRYPNGRDYDIAFYVPFMASPFNLIFANFDDAAATPLLIDGHRLLLVFGPATNRPYPAPGFGILEWRDNDFEPFAGGILEKFGLNPAIE
jgi:hypothetical protein